MNRKVHVRFGGGERVVPGNRATPSLPNPWEPRAFVQRTGRATRLGAGAKQIAILVPILRFSIEERVAKVLLPRAAAAVATLAKQGEADPIAEQLHGLAGELSGSEGASTFLEVCDAVLKAHRSGVGCGGSGDAAGL